jgi:hypothetical protein
MIPTVYAAPFSIALGLYARQRTHCLGTGRGTGSSRAPALPPHPFINRILSGQCAVESQIFAPCACDIAEIALPAALPGNAGAAGQGFNRHLVQAFASFAGGPAKGFVQRIRHVADRILHTIRCRRCRQEVQAQTPLFHSSASRADSALGAYFPAARFSPGNLGGTRLPDSARRWLWKGQRSGMRIEADAFAASDSFEGVMCQRFGGTI